MMRMVSSDKSPSRRETTSHPWTPDSVPSLAKSSFETVDQDSPLHGMSSSKSDVDSDFHHDALSQVRQAAFEYDRQSYVASDAAVASETSSIFGETVRTLYYNSNPHGDSPKLSSLAKPRAAVTSVPNNKASDNKGSKIDTVPIEPSCHGGLNLSPHQLASVFAFFEKSKSHLFPSTHPASQGSTSIPPSNDDTVADVDVPHDEAKANKRTSLDEDAVTTVTSNTNPNWDPRIDQLEQEVATLKDVLRQDSIMIVRLKVELDAEKESQKHYNIQQLALIKQFETIKRERDILLRREGDLLEIIEELKEEKSKYFAAQQSDQRNEVEELHEQVRQLQVENSLLASQIVTLEAQCSQSNALYTRDSDYNEDSDEDDEIVVIEEVVEHSSVVEQQGRNEANDDKYALAEQLRLLTYRLDEIERQSRLSAHSARNFTDEIIASEDIEVVLNGDIEQKASQDTAATKSTKATTTTGSSGGSWGSLCDCFPSFATIEDDK